jgi:hypothetical protein
MFCTRDKRSCCFCLCREANAVIHDQRAGLSRWSSWEVRGSVMKGKNFALRLLNRKKLSSASNGGMSSD